MKTNKTPVPDQGFKITHNAIGINDMLRWFLFVITTILCTTPRLGKHEFIWMNTTPWYVGVKNARVTCILLPKNELAGALLAPTTCVYIRCALLFVVVVS